MSSQVIAGWIATGSRITGWRIPGSCVIDASIIGACIALGASASIASAQLPGDDVVNRARRTMAVLARTSLAADPVLWPGFRPDTIPLQFVIPERGALLVAWPGSAPPGYTAVSGEQGMFWQEGAQGSAASTNVMVDGKQVAQLVVADTSLHVIAGLAAHEAFHVFQRASIRPGVRFGRAENSYYISQYPVFDLGNTAGIALEGLLLRDALLAHTAEAARSAARAFVAVREARQRELDPNIAEFETMTEMNEGLGEYIQLRVEAAAGNGSVAGALSPRLQHVTSDTERSVRLRFYATGAAQGLLLDRIGPSDWKAQLGSRNIRLHDLVAEAAGARNDERAMIAAAGRTHHAARLESVASAQADSLRARLGNRVEQLLAEPGVLLVVDSREAGSALNACSFDPQNLLQVGDGRLLHTRMLHACGSSGSVHFATPVVEDPAARILRAVVPAGDTLRIVAGGAMLDLADGEMHTVRELRLESRAVTATVPHARVGRRGSTITVVLLPGA